MDIRHGSLSPPVKLTEVPPGRVIEYGGHYYIVTNNIENDAVLVVDLETGKTARFGLHNAFSAVRTALTVETG